MSDPLGDIQLKEKQSYGDKVVESIPLAGSAVKTFTSASDALSDGSVSFGEVRGLAADGGSFIQSCTDAAQGIATDPVGWLVSQGLDFLLAVVQPLQDLIHMVSGDGPALAEAAESFNNIGSGLQEFGQKFGEDAVAALAEWEGGAAEAAAAKLAEFGKGIGGVAGEAGNIAQLLQISSMIMTVIEEFIKALLTELITWLIMIWIPALAAAIPTAGASTAAAGTATGVRAAQTGARASQQVSRLRKLLDRIKDILAKLKTWMSDLKTNFRRVMDTKKMQSSLARLEVESAAEAGRRASWSARLNNADGGMVGERVSTGFGPSVGRAATDNVQDHVKPGALAGHYDNAGKAEEYGDTGGEDQSPERTREQLDF
ncbi:hypothetical protein SAMN05421810_11148 [Amycolatopsis arida]|uniref:Proteins of 100 residues with WXG n=1 Tax=Amycolatopsis arida TaxID=587909 RepID=A0A1I6A3E0_9PSEU|nr:hypothetical protein [Amycolatopsis arida]TDX88643.1 hypothetical protein CLV69_111165 [Amycolatopsis arida]SFQ63219.1 hypothetical protein SAMN05421810_11148 [Amycolatopsis arida]